MRLRPLLAIVTALAVSAALAAPAGADDPPPGLPPPGMPPPASPSVVGFVYSPAGATVAGAFVSACQGPFSCPGSVLSGSNGAFTISGLPAGSYVLKAQPPSPPTGQPQWFTGSTTVEVTATPPTTADVTLVHGGRASGTVRDENGAIVPSGTAVDYRYEIPNTFVQAMGITTGDGGAYTTPWFPPGGTLTVTAGPTLTGVLVSSGPLTLDAREEKVVDLQLLGGGAWVQGTIKGAGVVLPNASVSVQGAEGFPMFASSDPFGEYRTFAMPAGAVGVSVTAPFGSNYAGAGQSVTLVAGPNTFDFDLPAGGILTGSVIGPDGSPLASGFAGACGVPPLPCAGGLVQGGSYTINGLASGTYTLTINGSGPPFPPPSIQQTGVVVVAGQTTLRDVSFVPGPPPADNESSGTLPPGGTVSTNPTATPEDPVGTSVTSPVAGTVSVQEESVPAGTIPPTGYGFLDQQVVITAPASDAASPLIFEFRLDASLVPAAGPNAVEVFRNGALVLACTDPASGAPAAPDPCVQSRSLDGAGDLVITVRTSAASTWNFGLDTAPPVVTCGSADGRWHNANVQIRCTTAATDLADPADATFPLTTNVVAGTETASAATDSRLVCDRAGNCATAGPVTGNKVDRRGPSIDLRVPADGARYGFLSRHVVDYACADSGSGVASCKATLADGARLPTGLFALGWNTFTVTATDRAGNRTVVTHRYRVELGR